MLQTCYVLVPRKTYAVCRSESVKHITSALAGKAPIFDKLVFRADSMGCSGKNLFHRKKLHAGGSQILEDLSHLILVDGTNHLLTMAIEWMWWRVGYPPSRGLWL